ncbi:hypothetical protein [Kitasatospora sp. NPDC058218]|uniref:hypothetical protein n=1 Tax=Kitasatospora sp. NPDC058218 TaxID=3346385 RepID=UPI0036DA66B5
MTTSLAGSGNDPAKDYATLLAELSDDLQSLRISRGNPPLQVISERSKSIKWLSVSGISEVLTGKRLPGREFLTTLVRVLLSYDEDGEPVRVERTSPEITEWSQRWMGLTALRLQLRRKSKTAAPPAGDTLARSDREIVGTSSHPAPPDRPSTGRIGRYGETANVAQTGPGQPLRSVRTVVEPYAWEFRTGTMPTLPGSVSQWPDQLRNLLTELDRGQAEAAAATRTPASGRSPLPALARAGLLKREGTGFVPTEAARLWHETGDPSHLLGALHVHVRFVGEVMLALAEGPLTHDGLLEIAKRRYGLRWESAGPVRDRTGWLRALRLADLYDGQVHLTEAGGELQPLLAPGAPEWEAEVESVELPVTPPAVGELLHDLDEKALRERPYASGLYVPGGQDEHGRLEALRILTEAATPSISDNALTKLILEHFPGTRSESSARAARDTARSLGLIRRASSTSWAATEAGEAWVNSEESINLARIIHTRVFYFGEILQELATAPQTAAELAERATAYTSQEYRPLRIPSIRARLDLLLACDLVAKMSQTVYRITALGRSFGEAVRCQTARTEPPADTTADTQARETPAGRPPTAPDLAAGLRNALLDSASPEQLRTAVLSALAHLGMVEDRSDHSSQEQGCHVRVGVGVESPVVAVATWSGAHDDESYLSDLMERRAKTGARTTLLIGSGFDHHLRKAADDDPAVAVILVATLADAVTAQAVTPLTPPQLRPLVDPGLRADQRHLALRQAWNEQLRRTEVERALVGVLVTEAEDPLQEGGWLDVPTLRRELRAQQRPASEAEVIEALDFLASPRLGVVERSGTGTGGTGERFRALATTEIVLQLMRGLGQQWAASNPGRACEINDIYRQVTGDS